MTKNRAPTPVYLDPGMHPGLGVKGLMHREGVVHMWQKMKAISEGVMKFSRFQADFVYVIL